nr:DUF2341 domain-containing protein [Candidatus Sigynarchaeota archaeon]
MSNPPFPGSGPFAGSDPMEAIKKLLQIIERLKNLQQSGAGLQEIEALLNSELASIFSPDQMQILRELIAKTRELQATTSAAIPLDYGSVLRHFFIGQGPAPKPAPAQPVPSNQALARGPSGLILPSRRYNGYEVYIYGKRYSVSGSNQGRVLNLRGLGIKDIAEIEGLNTIKAMDELDLSNNELSRFDGLASIPSLKRLKLTDNRITSLYAIKDMHALEYADLSGNKISEIPELTGVENLHTLLLDRNSIHTIQGLGRCLKLKTLSLNENKIESISGLDNLVDLDTLQLGSNDIERIGGLDNLRNVKSIVLSKNRISRIQGLDVCMDLQRLALPGNQIVTMENLERLVNLEELRLAGNMIREIAGLDTLGKLKILQLGDNKIAAISGLDALSNLEVLELHNNQIGELKGIGNLYKLQALSIDGNSIPREIFDEIKAIEGILPNPLNYIGYIASRELSPSAEAIQQLADNADKVLVFRLQMILAAAKKMHIPNLAARAGLPTDVLLEKLDRWKQAIPCKVEGDFVSIVKSASETMFEPAQHAASGSANVNVAIEGRSSKVTATPRLFKRRIALSPPTPSNDYQVRIDLGPSTIDYGKCQPGGHDIRFTDLDDLPIPYWIETWNENGQSTIWVRVHSEGTKEIIMTYGNQGLQSKSNGKAVFVLFDDFATTEINKDKWLIDTDDCSTASVNDSILTLESHPTVTTELYSVIGFSDTSIDRKEPDPAEKAKPKYKQQPTQLGQVISFDGDGFITRTYHQGNVSKDDHLACWLTGEIKWQRSSVVAYYKDDKLVTEQDKNIPKDSLPIKLWVMAGYFGRDVNRGAVLTAKLVNGYPGTSIRFRTWHYSRATKDKGLDSAVLKCDWVAVRKCSVVEPVPAFGSEECIE